MKNALIGVGAFALTAIVPTLAFAGTYQYVNVNGLIVTETASSAAEALTKPSDIALHSGVIYIPDGTEPLATTTIPF
jgi:hypothetical protein